MQKRNQTFPILTFLAVIQWPRSRLHNIIIHVIISSTHQTHAQQMFSNVSNPHMQWLLPLSPFGSFYDVLRSKFICVHYEIRPVFLATIWKCTDSFDYYCHILKCKLAFSLCSSIKISVEFETSSWVDHCTNFHSKK